MKNQQDQDWRAPIQTVTASPSPSLSLCLSSRPVIQRSVVQATALATVLPRAQYCRVRMNVPGGGTANHLLHPLETPIEILSISLPCGFSPSNGATPLCVISVLQWKISVVTELIIVSPKTDLSGVYTSRVYVILVNYAALSNSWLECGKVSLWKQHRRKKNTYV